MSATWAHASFDRSLSFNAAFFAAVKHVPENVPARIDHTATMGLSQPTHTTVGNVCCWGIPPSWMYAKQYRTAMGFGKHA